MTHPYRYWLALHPDIPRPIGGVKQMHRLAEALNNLGREARIIQENAAFHPGWFSSDVNTISYPEFRSNTDLYPNRDVVILPETFLPALPKYAPGIPKLLFNQNGAYSFGIKDGDGFPEPDEVLNLYSHLDLKHVLCVSRHDEILLKKGFNLGESRVSRIINSIETNLFQPSGPKQRIISYMPRKNSKDSAIVVALLKRNSWFRESGWSLQPINGLPQDDVARLLKKSMIFLSFGHPEGFGLPLAEAAGCGCYLIGYSGLGGREIFKLCTDNDSGKEINYGDWFGFVEVFSEFNKILQNNPANLAKRLVQTSKAVRATYSSELMTESIQIALEKWEGQL